MNIYTFTIVFFFTFAIAMALIYRWPSKTAYKPTTKDEMNDEYQRVMNIAYVYLFLQSFLTTVVVLDQNLMDDLSNFLPITLFLGSVYIILKKSRQYYQKPEVTPKPMENKAILFVCIGIVCLFLLQYAFVELAYPISVKIFPFIASMFLIIKFVMKYAFNAKKLLPSDELFQMIHQICNNAKMKTPTIYLYGSDDGSPNAFASGIIRLPFLSSFIMISRGLLKKHTPEEVHAVIAHELVHVKRFHILKGMFVFILFVFGYSILFSFLSFYLFFLSFRTYFVLQSITTIPIVFIIFSYYRKLQEIEADVDACIIFKANPSAQKKVLNTLAETLSISKKYPNLFSYFIPLIAHPTIEKRCQYIDSLNKQTFPWKKLALVPLSVFVIYFSYINPRENEIISAVENNDIAYFKEALKKTNINRLCVNGDHVLKVAAETKKTELMKFFLDGGINPSELQCSSIKALLVIPLQKKDFETLDLFLTYIPKLDKVQANFSKYKELQDLIQDAPEELKNKLIIKDTKRIPASKD